MAKSFPEIFESFTSVMELLRNEQFQKLLVDYERAKKVFLVGYEVQDEVSSMILFEAEGRYGLQPVDYLLAFPEFVKRKEKEMNALIYPSLPSDHPLRDSPGRKGTGLPDEPPPHRKTAAP